MTVTQPAGNHHGFHAFTAALAARDVDALVATLAPDAVLHSAVTDVPFEGRELLRDLYTSLFDTFEELRVTDEFTKGDTLVFFWEGRMDGRFVEGADRVPAQQRGPGAGHHDRGRPAVRAVGFHHEARNRLRAAAGAERSSHACCGS